MCHVEKLKSTFEINVKYKCIIPSVCKRSYGDFMHLMSDNETHYVFIKLLLNSFKWGEKKTLKLYATVTKVCVCVGVCSDVEKGHLLKAIRPVTLSPSSHLLHYYLPLMSAGLFSLSESPSFSKKGKQREISVTLP